jgi:hypothetical protein
MKIAEYTLREAKILTAKPDFQADVRSIRESYRNKDMPLKGFKDETELEAWREKHIYYQKNANSEVALDNGVATVLKKYNLGPDWRHAVKRYVLLNDINKMQLPTKISGGPVMDKDTGRWRTIVYLPEYAMTPQIRAAIPQMNEWQAMTREWNKMPKPNMQPIAFQDLADEALSIYKRVGSYSKAAKELNKLRGTNYEVPYVRGLIRNYKNRIGKS